MAARWPIRYQVLAVFGILLYTAALGACSMGVRAELNDVYAMPACVEACHANHLEASDVDIRMGKREHSVCSCTSGLRLPSREGDTAGGISILVPVTCTLIGMGLVALWASRRARARNAK